MLASRKDITKLPGRGGLSPVSGRASSNTRSNGTVARSLPESKEICATRAALSKSPEATGTVIGTNPVNQPVVLSSVGVLRVSVVVTTSNVSQFGQLALSEGGAGENATAKTGARSDAGGFESLALLLVHQRFGKQLSGMGHR